MRRTEVREHQEQEGIPEQELEDQDPDPPAAAEGQGVDSKDKVVSATCGLREPNTGSAEVIDLVQCDSCQKRFHDACVGWEKGPRETYCAGTASRPGTKGQ